MIRAIAEAVAGAAIILAVAGLFLFNTPAHAATCAGQMVTASWYGSESGNRTASGMRFDGSQLIVAHKSLPFGTKLRLTYRGRSIVVPVEDRGPFIAGRTLDISEAVARRLGTKNAGVVRLCMVRL